MQIITIWDNGGKTCDRYTVQIDNDYFGMSDDPLSPQGFNQYLGEYPEIIPGPHLGKRVKYENLPETVQKAIQLRIE